MSDKQDTVKSNDIVSIVGHVGACEYSVEMSGRRLGKLIDTLQLLAVDYLAAKRSSHRFQNWLSVQDAQHRPPAHNDVAYFAEIDRLTEADRVAIANALNE